MRRTLSAVLLMIALALPLCAQRHSSGGMRGGGAVGVRTQARIGIRSQGRVGIGGGIAFGHNPHFRVFVNSRSRYGARRYYPSPYVQAYPYLYPYAAYPAYPVAVYDTFDDYVPATPPESVYPYPYYPGQQVGLAEQMREQHVGIYRDQAPPEPALTPAQPTVAGPPPPELPPTVLVYRDGQRNEVRNYAIVGQTLWIFSEERAQKVPLAELDLDSTRSVNEERGVEFAVPAAPASSIR